MSTVVGLGSLIQRLHHHPHSHPLPDVRPGTRTVTQESAPGGSELHHEVQRQLGANSDFARTDRGSWPSLPIFYQPYKAAGKVRIET